MRVGPWRRLNSKELMLSNCGAGEDSLESLGVQGDQPVNLKGNQLWIFIGRTDAEAEALILWPPNVKSRFIGKDPDAGKDWRQEEKEVVEDKMVKQNHRLNGHEFKQTSGDSRGQRNLVGCSPWRGNGKKMLWMSTITDGSGRKKPRFKSRSTVTSSKSVSIC